MNSARQGGGGSDLVLFGSDGVKVVSCAGSNSHVKLGLLRLSDHNPVLHDAKLACIWSTWLARTGNRSPSSGVRIQSRLVRLWL